MSTIETETVFIPRQWPGDGRRAARRGAHHPGSEDPRRRRTRILRRAGIAAAASLAVVTAPLLVPVPFVDGFAADLVSQKIASSITCQGGAAPEVTVSRQGMLRQLARGRLDQVDLSLANSTIGGVANATFTAKLRDLQTSGSPAKVGSVDAAIAIPFASMAAATEGGPPATFGSSDDGVMTITVDASEVEAADVESTVFLKLTLDGNTLSLQPQQLQLFGKTIPAEDVGDLTGGVRTTELPALPNGLQYQSITPESDGLRVALGGAVVTPLDELPTDIDGQTVSYSARDGLLGISTRVELPILPDQDLTIFVEPTLDGQTLTMVPRSVEALGENRPPDDPVARLVLGQINQDELSQELPPLPDGMRYQAVSVDGAGMRVAVGGATVQPFSTLPVPEDSPPVTFGAERGLLTATSTGGAAPDEPTPIVLKAKPTIENNQLNLNPHQIEIFGAVFPAEDVLAEMGSSFGGGTTFPLEALPGGLTYSGVEVLPEALRLRVSGTDVALDQSASGGPSLC